MFSTDSTYLLLHKVNVLDVYCSILKLNLHSLLVFLDDSRVGDKILQSFMGWFLVSISSISANLFKIYSEIFGRSDHVAF